MTQKELSDLVAAGKVEVVTDPPAPPVVPPPVEDHRLDGVNNQNLQVKQHLTTVPPLTPTNFPQQIQFFDDGTKKGIYAWINNQWVLFDTVPVTDPVLPVILPTNSAELASIISDPTGTGFLVFSNSPVLLAPDLGTPTALVGTNITGTGLGFTAGQALVAATAELLTTPRLINGVAFDGSENITVPAAALTLTGTVLNPLITNSALTSFGVSPTLIAPDIGIATGTSLALLQGIAIGTPSSIAGTLVFRNQSNANTLTMKSGVVTGSYTLTWPVAVGAAGQVLTTSAAGVLSWTTPAGGGGLTWGTSIHGTTADGLTLTIDTIPTAGMSALKLINTGGGAKRTLLNIQRGNNQNAQGIMVQGWAGTFGGPVGTGDIHLNLWSDIDPFNGPVFEIAHGSTYTPVLTITDMGYIVQKNKSYVQDSYTMYMQQSGSPGTSGIKIIANTVYDSYASTGVALNILTGNIPGVVKTMGLLIQGTGSLIGGGPLTGTNHMTIWANVDGSVVKGISMGSGVAYAEKAYWRANGLLGWVAGNTQATVGAAGAAAALPILPLGYLLADREGVTIKIPYYNA